MKLPLWKRILCKEEGWNDFEFYKAHDKELYFWGMVGVAACSTVITICGGLFSLIYDAMSGAIVMLIGLLMFSQVKMYLHIRKDAIEIKEMLRK